MLVCWIHVSLPPSSCQYLIWEVVDNGDTARDLLLGHRRRKTKIEVNYYRTGLIYRYLLFSNPLALFKKIYETAPPYSRNIGHLDKLRGCAIHTHRHRDAQNLESMGSGAAIGEDDVNNFLPDKRYGIKLMPFGNAFFFVSPLLYGTLRWIIG